jgi:hypothetical protein
MTFRSSLSDTSPEAAALQIDLLREAGMARRLEITCALTQQMIEQSRQAVRCRHPAWNEQQVRLYCVALWYGEDLAQRVQAALAQGAP